MFVMSGEKQLSGRCYMRFSVSFSRLLAASIAERKL